MAWFSINVLTSKNKLMGECDSKCVPWNPWFFVLDNLWRKDECRACKVHRCGSHRGPLPSMKRRRRRCFKSRYALCLFLSVERTSIYLTHIEGFVTYLHHDRKRTRNITNRYIQCGRKDLRGFQVLSNAKVSRHHSSGKGIERGILSPSFWIVIQIDSPIILPWFHAWQWQSAFGRESHESSSPGGAQVLWLCRFTEESIETQQSKRSNRHAAMIRIQDVTTAHLESVLPIERGNWSRVSKWKN